MNIPFFQDILTAFHIKHYPIHDVDSKLINTVNGQKTSAAWSLNEKIWKKVEAANIIENEKVQIVNVNNGERLETYVIKGERDSGVVCLNGPAARKCAVGDVVIIISYASMDFEEAKQHTPTLVFPDTVTNQLI